MKLKDLKVAVEERSNAVFSSFSCRREAMLFLKKKVHTHDQLHTCIEYLSYLLMYHKLTVTLDASSFLFDWGMVILLLSVDLCSISSCCAASRKQKIQRGRQESTSCVLKVKQMRNLGAAVLGWRVRCSYLLLLEICNRSRSTFSSVV